MLSLAAVTYDSIHEYDAAHWGVIRCRKEGYIIGTTLAFICSVTCAMAAYIPAGHNLEVVFDVAGAVGGIDAVRTIALRLQIKPFTPARVGSLRSNCRCIPLSLDLPLSV